MFGLNDISLDFLADSWFLIVLALLILIGLSIYTYIKTNPPLPLWLRGVLMGLRLVAVVALVFALLEPVFSYSRSYERQKKVALLLDESASMNKVELEKSRLARRDSLLSSAQYAYLKNQADIDLYYFGGNLVENAGEVDRDKSALGDAIYQLEQKELEQPSDVWLVISDGNSNSGREIGRAASGLPTPILAIDIAGGSGNFDVGIVDVEFNPVMFVGQPSEIKLKLNWHDAAGRNLLVQLLDSARVATQTEFRISQEEGFGDLTLSYTPTSPGQKILRLKVPSLENEENVGNNQRSLSVKVLKSRLLVLLAAERPDYEVGFLKRFLEQADRYDVDLIATGNKAGNLKGVFPDRQTELNRYDLVILYDPSPDKLSSRQDILASYLSDRGGAVWVIMGEQYARAPETPWLNDFLPFYPTVKQGMQYISFHGEPAEGNLFHPSVRLADEQATIRSAWMDLPPFQTIVRCDQVTPGSTILAYASVPTMGENSLPILGYHRHGPGKVLASAALPFWTWAFTTLGMGDDNSFYGKFVDGSVSWLTVSDDLDPVRISPEKEVYNRGEEIVFKGFAFDLGFRPIPGVTGEINLSELATGEKLEADLIEHEAGNFRASFKNLPPGEYSYRGDFKKEGLTLKEASGRILIESFSLEEFDQSGDPDNLRALAHLSGGSYYSYNDFDDALANLDVAPKAVLSHGEIPLWNKTWLLLLFIVALSVEWLLRKIYQLV